MNGAEMPSASPRTPWGQLIRTARRSAGLTIPEAAAIAGISSGQWGHVERGYRTVDGKQVNVDGTPGTVAHMAAAAGVDPQRLGTAGKRPDAADVLTEILLRRAQARRAAQPDGHDQDPPGEGPENDAEAVIGMLIGLVAAPEQPDLCNALRLTWQSRRDGVLTPLEQRLRMLKAVLGHEPGVPVAEEGEHANGAAS